MRPPRLPALLALALGLSACFCLGPSLRAPAPGEFPRTAARVARGRYLAENVAACVNCHSPKDFAAVGAPAIKGRAYEGGTRSGKAEGIPGVLFAPNLTADPATGLGRWTDGEILRALREGVDRHGHTLFPLMPYPDYRALADEDAEAIVAYLRTIPPIVYPVPPSHLDFPVSIFINAAPKPETGPVAPPATDAVSRGRYLARMAGCFDCHTPMHHGRPVKGMEGAGGSRFQEGDADHRFDAFAPNLTPDRETGLGTYSDAEIALAITQGKAPRGGELQPIMPWIDYAGMTPDDVRALVAYLRTLRPIRNLVPGREALTAKP